MRMRALSIGCFLVILRKGKGTLCPRFRKKAGGIIDESKAAPIYPATGKDSGCSSQTLLFCQRSRRNHVKFISRKDGTIPVDVDGFRT